MQKRFYTNLALNSRNSSRAWRFGHRPCPETDGGRRHGATPPGPWPLGADPTRNHLAPPVNQDLTVRVVAPGLEDGEQGLIEELAEAFLGQPAVQPLALPPPGTPFPFQVSQCPCLPGREKPSGQGGGNGAVAGFQVHSQRLAGHGRQGGATAVAQAQMPALEGVQPGRLTRISPQRHRPGSTAQHPGRQAPQQHPAPQHLPGPLR